MKCTAGKETPLGVTGDHDWVLVKSLRDYADGTISRLLWACPCDEFRWTSYAQWKKGQPQEIMTNDPNQGESTAAKPLTVADIDQESLAKIDEEFRPGARYPEAGEAKPL